MKHLLLIRLSAMGDVAMTAPVVRNLRARYPELRITVLTRPFFRVFYRDIPNLEFAAFDPKNRHKGVVGLLRLTQEICSAGTPDCTVDLHDVLRTKILRQFLRLRGSRIVVFDKGRNEKQELVKRGAEQCNPLKTTLERYADAFRTAGFTVEVPHELTPVATPIPTIFGQKTEKWIGIAPFAQHTGKILPLEKIERIVAQLSRETGRRIFLFGGGPTERAYAEKLEQRYPHVTSAIGKVALSEELDLIAHLDLMVSMDSSAMHMASLMGVRCLSIWGATHPAAGFLGAAQKIDDTVGLSLPCRPCSVYGNRPCRMGGYPCLNQIDENMIVGKIIERI